MNIGYNDTGYEKYDPNKIKKKRKFVKDPLLFNMKNLIILIIILTIIFVFYDYCAYNFDIDLEEEYKNYKDTDLLFGKMNICQYATRKIVFNTLTFQNIYVSLIFYIIVFVLILLFLNYLGFLEKILFYMYVSFMKYFSLTNIFYNNSFYEMSSRLYDCRKPLLETLFRA